ncbi:ATP-dependent Clp protease ATP-binding subunit ClpX [Candidatus Magnetomoraceae bacterium gMMP-15]
MKDQDSNIPHPKEIERALAEFLSKKFGGNVKVVSSMAMPDELFDKGDKISIDKSEINFSIKPEELISYLDQYIVKQDMAKAVLSTKICTHFNRIKLQKNLNKQYPDMVGRIKNNVLIMGPTGVGKTYMIKLIAQKIGVPFVKGDATKFSETGYVGGDVEDLVRDLLKEANDNIELAQCGIIYIDEIDKIASSGNLIGHDISRSGVQRALLKPMEDTDIDLKIPHDPIAMFQELERFRKTGVREKRVINTKNILFIMSGAFTGLTDIIKKRMDASAIGFSSKLSSKSDAPAFLQKVKAEDMIEYGFETEFIGRLPVISVLDQLNEDDLYTILKNPNNPTILGKKLDFSAYEIDVKFEDSALRILAKRAYSEKTGARGLVSAIENAILAFEKKLPSANIKRFSVTSQVIENPDKVLSDLLSSPHNVKWLEEFKKLAEDEQVWISEYITKNRDMLDEKYDLTLSPSRINLAASIYCQHIMDIGMVMEKITDCRGQLIKVEDYFFKNHKVKPILEEDALDFIIDKLLNGSLHMDAFYKQLNSDFEYGLKWIAERTDKTEFFISKEGLINPENFLDKLVKEELKEYN